MGGSLPRSGIGLACIPDDLDYWLIRPKPLPDELLSSWLVRLAHGLGCKVQTLTCELLGQEKWFWGTDIDRTQDRALLKLLADRTATPLSRVYGTTLASYEGHLWESYSLKGPLQWLTPCLRQGRHRAGKGQQYCPLCLLQDDAPYFRRHWRLACFVVCVEHGVVFQDCCQACGAPIEFHAHDFGSALLDEEIGNTKCGRCHTDLREGVADSDVSKAFIAFQRSMLEALNEGFSSSLPGAQAYSHLFFQGLVYVIRLLATNGHGCRLRELLLQSRGRLPLPTAFPTNRCKFEELSLPDRKSTMEMASEFFDDWPETFVARCRDSRVSSSYMLEYRGRSQPFWFEDAVRRQLSDLDYAPSELERRSVEEYLVRIGEPVSQNAVKRLLGVACQRRQGDPLAPPRNRWNPRGN